VADAVVIGAGPNGLVAANVLADAGWQVLVLEAQAEPGGAVRSDQGVGLGFESDLFSSFYPLAMASPVIHALRLDEHGLSWSHAPTVLAHPLPDGRCAVVQRGAEQTAAGLEDAFGRADARAWLELSDLWDELSPHLMRTLLSPFPPIRSGLALAAKLRGVGALHASRFLTLPVCRLAEEEFTSPGPGLLLTGCALHADISPEGAGSAAMGWMMAMLGQQHGWPVPVGGASSLTAALVRRLESRGGSVRCGERVEEVIVHDGRARGVRTADGHRHQARRAVIAAVPAPALYGRLVSWDRLPARLRTDMRRFQWGPATFKVDWTLTGPIPWTADDAARAGAVHVGADLTELSDHALQIATGRASAQPFVIVGQMTTADPSRSPHGTQAAWGYTHLPRSIAADLGEGSVTGEGSITGSWDAREAAAMADRLERQVERFAPGFRDLIGARRILTPAVLEAMNESLVGGALDGGTANLHQQLVFRPVPGLARPETPVTHLYLASSSAHPGGGVHGVCGANAARAAIRAHRLLGGRITAPGLAAARRLLTGPARPRTKKDVNPWPGADN
jgi:phytoene dehydrogenase-like protein